MTPLQERVIVAMQALGRETSLEEIYNQGKFESRRDVAVALHHLSHKYDLVSCRESKVGNRTAAMWSLNDTGRAFRAPMVAHVASEIPVEAPDHKPTPRKKALPRPENALAEGLLGKKVRDTVTKITGTVTGVAIYMDGLPSAGVEYVDAQGVPRTQWITQSRLETIVP